MPVSGVPTDTSRATFQVPAGRAFARVGRAVRSNRKATAGTVLLVIFILIAVFPWVIARDSPSQDAYAPQLGLSTAHLLAPITTGRTCSRSWSGAPGTC